MADFLLEHPSADFKVYSTSNNITSVCECELFIEVPITYIYTHSNVGKVYLSCVSAVHFLVVLVIQILMVWLCFYQQNYLTYFFLRCGIPVVC